MNKCDDKKITRVRTGKVSSDFWTYEIGKDDIMGFERDTDGVYVLFSTYVLFFPLFNVREVGYSLTGKSEKEE